MASNAPLVTLTLNPALDLSCSVDHVIAEEKLECSDLKTDPGGGGINVARAAKILGGDVSALWAGGGSLGTRLAQALADEGVAHRQLSVDGETRQNVTVFEEASSRQYRFGMPGPSVGPGEVAQFEQAIAELEPPEYLVISGSLPHGASYDCYARMVRQCRPPTRVVLDTRGPALRRALEAGVYLVKPNLRELRQLAGEDLQSDADIRDASKRLLDAGWAEVVVTSIGAGGAIAVTAEGCQHVRAPTVHIRSKVGAGDSTVGGLVYSLQQGYDIKEAVRYGVAAGAAAVMTPGTALCRREDVERLYASMD